MLCVPKKEHNDAETEAINRFLTFFGSVEGQQAFISKSLMVCVPLDDSPAMAGIEKVMAKGHMFSRLDFPGQDARTWTIKDNALAMITEGKTSDEVIAEIDAPPIQDRRGSRNRISCQAG